MKKNGNSVNTISFRLSDAELNAFNDMVKELNCKNKSDFLKLVLFEQFKLNDLKDDLKLFASLFKEIRDFKGELSKLGINVNQIARSLHVLMLIEAKETQLLNLSNDVGDTLRNLKLLIDSMGNHILSKLNILPDPSKPK